MRKLSLWAALGAAPVLSACGKAGAGGYLPVLARSPVILDPVGFNAIVLEGAKKPHGMAPFRRFFNEASAEDLRAYLLAEADKPPPAGEPQMTHGR